MEKKVLKRLTALGLASLLLSGTVLSQTVYAEDNQAVTTAQFKVQRDGSQSIVGKTTPNTRLRIEHDGTIVAVSDAEGNFELKIPEDKKYGNYEYISIYSLDTEGNQNRIAEVQTDTQAPELNGISLATGDTTLSLFLDDDAESISLKIGDRVYQGEKTENRNWEIKFPFVSEGDTVTLTATDKTGNMTEQTVTVRGLEAPSATHTVDYGDTNQFIKGRTYPNATVHVLLPNKKELTTTSNDNGEFKLELTEENWFYENEGKAQVWVVHQGGFSSPKKTVEKNSWPLDSIFTGYEFQVKDDGSQSLKFGGSGYRNKKITVNLPSGETLSPTKDKDGNQQIMFSKDKALKHNQLVTVQFKNNVGKWMYTIIPDVEAPAIPVVNEISAGDKVIGGTAEKDKGTQEVKDMMYNVSPNGSDDSVLVTLPNGKIRSIVPDKYGNWILSIPTVKKGDVITVRAKDFVGNISEPRIIKVGTGEVKDIHETGQANIQAELPEFPIKDVPEVDKDKKPTPPSNDDKKDPSTKKPVITSKGESTVQEELPEFPVELVPTFSGKQGRQTGQNLGNGNLGQGSQGLQNVGNQGQKSSKNSMTSKKASLPKTGETASTLAFLAGLVVMGLAFLGFKSKRD